MLQSHFLQLLDSNEIPVFIQQIMITHYLGNVLSYENIIKSSICGLNCVTSTVGADSNDDYKKIQKKNHNYGNKRN